MKKTKEKPPVSRLAYHPWEVAEMHGVSKAIVARAIADGRLRIAKFGRLISAKDAFGAADTFRPLGADVAPDLADPCIRELPELTTPELASIPVKDTKLLVVSQDKVSSRRLSIPSADNRTTKLLPISCPLLGESENPYWNKAGAVYFLQVADTVKIGFSTDVADRVRKLKTGFPGEFRLIHTVVGTPATERNFHRKFAEHRVGGEWFRLTGTLWEWLSMFGSLGEETVAVSKRQERRLTAKHVENAERGHLSDGGGLYLTVDKNGRKSWIWRYRFRGRRRDMGLGSASDVSLAQARAERDRWRRKIADGEDPIDDRRRANLAAKTNRPDFDTFGAIATAYIAEHEKSWRNAKHRAQWRMTLEVHAKKLWEKPVEEVRTADVLEVLKPIWQAAPETASRVRGRIEAVLDAAQALGHIEEGRANPARWKGHLAKLLAKRQRLSRGHHAAMPFKDVPAFAATLRNEQSVGARAFEFLILTAARTSEVTRATWDEVDLEAKIWTVPKARMKAGREHRVPLSARALSILHDMKTLKSQGTRSKQINQKTPQSFIFPGLRLGRPLSNMVFARALRRRGLDVTAHGFRSSFRDWAGDETHFPRELIEAALAHVIGDKAEQAYRRSDALDRRRKLMEGWQQYLEATPANVIRLRG